MFHTLNYETNVTSAKNTWPLIFDYIINDQTKKFFVLSMDKTKNFFELEFFWQA